MKLAVIIPAYNEEKTIAQVIREIPRNIEGINEVEVLVIDDGSTDNTIKEARNAGALVASHTKNEGLGISFSTGIREALKRGADIIVNIDADNQFDSNDIPKLVKPILENRADMVTGTRFKEGKIIPNMSELKRRGNKFFVWLVNLMTGSKFTDVSCGFRAYSRNTALYLNLFGRFTYTQEVFLDLVNKNKQIEEVPINRNSLKNFS
jgi:glycosyltransferase involved in cell wall biosynthesis